MTQEKTVLGEDDVRRALVRIAHEIAERNADGDPLAIVGIHRRGAFLAARLQPLVADLLDADVPLGDLDISFYRDDVALRADSPVVNATHLDFPIEGRTVIVPTAATASCRFAPTTSVRTCPPHAASA
jgi:pyrimidine operon attenuation protein / uracil phosphoribosyltransferase